MNTPTSRRLRQRYISLSIPYILETFPIFKDQEIEDFGDYRAMKRVLPCFDQLEEATEQGQGSDPQPAGQRALRHPC